MTVYRARVCPKCQYYVGYSVSKPVNATLRTSIKSFCLNCNYQLPVRAVLRGSKNFPLRLKSPVATKRSREATPDQNRALLPGVADSPGHQAVAPGANYPRELRAIGQELEKRGFTTFNLKCSADSYFVWSRETIPPAPASDLGKVQAGSFGPASCADAGDAAKTMLLDRVVGFLFSATEIKRLECEGVQNRRREAVNTGRRLSHLLRTVGEEVRRRHRRLLAISWQDHQISVVSENSSGRRDINILRTDNLYDLWVRMYLQRSRQ